MECTPLMVHLQIGHHQKYRKTCFDDEQSNEMFFFLNFLQRQKAQNPKWPPILAQMMVHDIKAALIKWLGGGGGGGGGGILPRFSCYY